MTDNDDCPTCAETYVTLRVLRADLIAQDVTTRLGLQPSCVQQPASANGKRAAKLGGWFLRSSGHVSSNDAQRHLDWLLTQLEDRSEPLQKLETEGYLVDVSCFWLSRHAHGGPTLSPDIMRRLSELKLQLWFDIYHAR